MSTSIQVSSKQDVFVKHYAHGSNKVGKAIFSVRGQRQGHKVIDLSVIWKGIAKVRVNNRQTDRETNRIKTICP